MQQQGRGAGLRPIDFKFVNASSPACLLRRSRSERAGMGSGLHVVT